MMLVRRKKWKQCKKAITDVATQFGAFADFERVGVKKDGTRTIIIAAVKCPTLNMNPSEIPDPMIDRLAEVLNFDGVKFEREKDFAIEEDQRHRNWPKYNAGTAFRAVRRFAVELGRRTKQRIPYIHQVGTNPEIIWMVRIEIPKISVD